MDALLGQRIQDGASSRRALLRQAILFVVDEEKRFVLTVEQSRNADWTTNLATWLIEKDALLRRLLRHRVCSKVAIVEPVVCVECGIAMIPIYAAVILVGPTLRNKLDLHCTLCRALGTRS